MLRKLPGVWFRRGDDVDVEPQMRMRRPADSGGLKTTTAKVEAILGRGRGRYVRAPGSSMQRATVKTKVVKPAGKAKDHARYLEKEAAGLDGEEVHGFTATKDRIDMAKFAQGWDEDRHYFQSIISPEHGDRLDMQQYVRAVVTRWEKDLETKLTWTAVIHFDTEHPHAHVMIRGKDDRGGDLVIDREYLRHAMRHRAMEVATQELGPRSAQEIVAAMVTSSGVVGIGP
jgi:type IV secretory pathway VirD2 relaxase